MTLPPIVKQPHYVWRYYLQAWEVSGKLQVLRNREKVFPAAAAKVAREGGFHRLRELSDSDVAFIKAVCIVKGSAREKMHSDFLDKLVFAQRICQAVVDGPNAFPQDAIDAARKILHDAEEEIQSSIETLGMPWLIALRKKDCSFLEEERESLFYYFIAMQYMRSKAIQSSVLDALGESNLAVLKPMMERTWPYQRHIHAVDVAANLFATRGEFNLIFLINKSEIPFIAGDWPLINTHATASPRKIPEKFEIYYPLSPSLAMLYTPEREYGKSGTTIEIGYQMVTHFNDQIATASSEMIFADREDALLPYRE
ncbi:DUF4238 domain-containing protein [Sphingomonas suaedae]|uniref:DUF4238 domain-containing protein n=1 Tax=Sphingomonas suaedae TaxID=2599297 RepID=A0A518RDL6_9SPHN|nr:DUF4238 domain-containing protein [Sphingomonas suaedae]QDX25481.1 DUF4238 domain-containing protein [Sphingomonas suaedae]